MQPSVGSPCQALFTSPSTLFRSSRGESVCLARRPLSTTGLTRPTRLGRLCSASWGLSSPIVQSSFWAAGLRSRCLRWRQLHGSRSALRTSSIANQKSWLASSERSCSHLPSRAKLQAEKIANTDQVNITNLECEFNPLCRLDLPNNGADNSPKSMVYFSSLSTYSRLSIH